MGGRIHGFLGGVLFTSAITYLTKLQIQNQTTTITTSLQQSNDILVNRNKPKFYKEDIIDYQSRPFAETVKDIWNDEIIYMTNKLYSFNVKDIQQEVTKYIK